MQRLCILLMIHIVAVGESQMRNGYDPHMSAGSREGNAFYALRSCHQILHGDSGEFFSPDYLCSNPALWCNWTIQVPRGKRVQLYLEDLTPEHACHLKVDQIHLDESPVAAGESRILERCWRSSTYKSVSNTVHVVQLIGPNLTPPYRGFYGVYQAFGLPEPPDPDEEVSVEGGVKIEEVEAKDAVTTVPEQKIFSNEVPLPLENVDGALVEHVEVGQTVDPWLNELLTVTTGSWEKTFGEIRKTRGGAENQEVAIHEALYHSDVGFVELVSMPTENPNWTTVDEYSTEFESLFDDGSHDTHTVAPTYSALFNSTQTQSTKEVELVPTQLPTTTATVNQNEVTHTPDDPTEAKMVASTPTVEEVGAVSMEMLVTNGGATLRAAVEEHVGGFGANRWNSTKKIKPSHRIKGKSLPMQTFRNASEPPHLPGGLLLEVSIEVSLDRGHKDSWDHIRKPFNAAVEAMIQKALGNLNLKTVSSKRSKKLSAGALFIVWVQCGEGDEKGHTNRVLQSTLKGLKGQSINPPDTKSHGIVTSVSVEDIDECETQMVMCDVHAECVNEFGSYSCHCRHGYSPVLGRATCVEPERDDCRKTSVPTLLYVVCFLLCFLIGLLLVVLGLMYRRYHRGTFLPRCQRSSFAVNDINNNPNSGSGGDGSSSRFPPPPPSRQASKAPDLPLLRFSPLAPPEAVEGKPQREKDEL